MPKPIYILCSESGAEDKDSGQSIHFKVIDRLLLMDRVPEKPAGVVLVRPIPLHITAVWMRADTDDSRDQFETQVRIFLPPYNVEWIPAPSTTFSFSQPRYRTIMKLAGLLLTGPGQLLIESRIRKVGDENWLSQSYPIDVIAAEGTAQAPPSEDGIGGKTN